MVVDESIVHRGNGGSYIIGAAIIVDPPSRADRIGAGS